MSGVPLFIACADLHLMSGTPPECRTETDVEYRDTIIRKLITLKKCAELENVFVIYVGDIFDTWQCGHDLVGDAASYLPRGFCVAGQHELPYHDPGQFRRSPLFPLRKMGIERLGGDSPIIQEPDARFYGASWGEELPSNLPPSDMLTCGFMHRTVWPENDPPFPGAPADGMALTVLKQHPDYDIIVTGDNHKPFIVRYCGGKKEQLLINCGSMLRLSADQADYIPKFHVVYSDMTVASAPYLDELRPISREHLVAKEQREERAFSFLEKLKEGVEGDCLDFEKELEQTLAASGASATVVKKVWELVGKAKERK